MPPAVESVHRGLREHGMVVAQEKLAARIGADILQPAAMPSMPRSRPALRSLSPIPAPAISAAAASWWSISPTRNEDIAIDYRETAPAATTRDMFLGRRRQGRPAKSRDSGLGVGVPGTVAGLALAHGEIRLRQIHAGAN